MDSKHCLTEYDRIYMVITDRFFDGDKRNNGVLGCEYRPGQLHYYQGGDWNGLEQKLDYIKALGFTAVWISPPQDNALFSRSGDEAGYHGYYTRDFNRTNPHFGTEQELRHLMNEAEAQGLKVILDAQLNHTAGFLNEKTWNYDNAYARPAPPFDNPAWYHHMPHIRDFDDETERRYGSLGGLDDLAQENPACFEALLKAYWQPELNKGWFSYGFAGARLDAVMEIPERYLSAFEQHIGKPCFGEAYTGLVSVNAPYQRAIWSVLDYPLHFRMHNVFYENADWSKIQEIFDQDGEYRAPNRLLTFLDNHDRQRFLGNAGDNYDKLRMALAFLYCIRGIPILYYGTEQAMGADWRYTDELVNDVNRQMMPAFDTQAPLFMWIKRLNEIRETHAALFAEGEQRTLHCQVGDPVYAVQRRREGEEILVGAFNNSPIWQTRLLPLPNAENVNCLHDLLDTSYKARAFRGKLLLALPPFGARLLVAKTDSKWMPPPKAQTVLRFRCDCGWGNYLTVRGDTPPLCWERGIRCETIAPDLWQCTLERPKEGKIQYKALLNDAVWETGENHTVQVHTCAENRPAF